MYQLNWTPDEVEASVIMLNLQKRFLKENLEVLQRRLGDGVDLVGVSSSSDSDSNISGNFGGGGLGGTSGGPSGESFNTSNNIIFENTPEDLLSNFIDVISNI